METGEAGAAPEEATASERKESETSGPSLTVGLITDPDSPTRIADRIADELPDELARRIDSRMRWNVQVSYVPITATHTSESEAVLNAAATRKRRADWDLAIVLTDLPFRKDWRPVIADVSTRRGVADLSLPGLSGIRLTRRTREAIVDLVAHLVGGKTPTGLGSGLHHWAIGRRLTRLAHPVRRVEPEHEEVDVRYMATRIRGRARLLFGMVRSNEPWNLVFSMGKALAAALAFGAFMLQSTSIWQMSAMLGPLRMVVAMLGAIGVMATWMIFAHGLWERSGRGRLDREEVWLYNSATVGTLVIGVLSMYAVVFGAILLAALLIIPGSLLGQTIGRSAGPGSYLALAWFSTTAVIVAGALGSTLESDQAVRQAAYGYRERQRRKELERQEEEAEGEGSA